MATQITADLPTLDFPREVDYPTQEDWAAFSAAAEENFGILGGDWSTQMQLWKTEANAMSMELNTNATIAQGLANYQGDWVSQGYTLGQTVSVSGVYYICKLTHASGQNPSTGGSIYWNLAIGNWNLKVDTNMSGYTSKTTPIDADLIPLSDSASTFGIKKLSWANTKATLISSFGVMISTLTAKTTPVDADIFTIGDSAATNASKKLTWANIKTALGSLFVSKVTSTDNAIVRFDGATGEVQNSSVIIDDNGTIITQGLRSTSPIYGIGYGPGAGGNVTQLTSKSTSVTLHKPTGVITMNNAALAAGASVSFQLNNSIISYADTVYMNGSNSNYKYEAFGSIFGAQIIKVTNVTGSNLSEAPIITFTIIKGANS